MPELLKAIANAKAQYHTRPQDFQTVVVLNSRVAFEHKYALNPDTKRHVRTTDGTGETKRHISYTIRLDDGTVTDVLVREDFVYNMPPSGVIRGCKAMINVIEGDVATQDYPKLGIKKGEHFNNVASFTFSMDNAEWNAINQGRGMRN